MSADKDVELEVVQAMSDPAFYHSSPTRVDTRESHISRVFMTHNRVYKIKRTVVFPFLDYSTLARRRAMCEAEVRLNRRFAPNIYMGVRPIMQHGSELSLGPRAWLDGRRMIAEDATTEDLPGDPREDARGNASENVIEWAVEMQRFPEECTMSAVLARGELTAADVTRVGHALAYFHERAEIAPEAAVPSRLRRTINLDLETLGDFLSDCSLGKPLHVRTFDSAQRFLHAALTGFQESLVRRGARNLVRDGHGDLRLEHILLLEDIAAVDCVEFNSLLRRIDVGDDLAYLVMELHAAGEGELAERLVGSYRDAGGDPGPDTLIAFFASYRALVRAKIALLRARDSHDDRDLEEFSALIDVAERLRWKARQPTVIVLCGGTAAGKSTTSRELARRSGSAVVSSDAVRKELAGIEPSQRAMPEHYDDERSAATYAELGRRARLGYERDNTMIVTATFRHTFERACFTAELERAKTEPLFVELRAPIAVLRERALAREQAREAPVADRVRPGEALSTDRAYLEEFSDAKQAHVLEHQAEFEPLDEVPAANHLTLRSDRPVELLTDELEAWLDDRLVADR